MAEAAMPARTRSPEAAAVGPTSGNAAGRLRCDWSMLVATREGHKTDTPMGEPTCSRSLARHSEKATTAYLLAQYTAEPAMVARPAADEVLTMWAGMPRARMRGKKLRTPCTTPIRFTPSTHLKSSSVASQAVPSNATPTLLKSQSTPPQRPQLASASSSTSAALDTSQRCTMHAAPA